MDFDLERFLKSKAGTGPKSTLEIPSSPSTGVQRSPRRTQSTKERRKTRAEKDEEDAVTESSSKRKNKEKDSEEAGTTEPVKRKTKAERHDSDEVGGAPEVPQEVVGETSKKKPKIPKGKQFYDSVLPGRSP